MIVRASKSLWHDVGPMGVASGPLRRSESIDLIVVGGGILGLSTALHAAGAGLSVRVVEAGEIGEQASGLNGGQVIPGLKYDPSSLRALFGEARGERIIAFAASTADKVFDLILNLRLDVPQRRSGWIQAAHEPKAARAAETRASEWRQCGADVAVLNGAEITSLTGARGYVGGWIDRRAGIIQPHAYTRELARAAIENGAKISTGTRVTRLLQNIDGWVAETTLGHELRARSVVVATNAYTDNLIPGLRESIIILHSFQIATAPLPPNLDAAILPGGQAVSDSRRILCYFRRSPDGRLVFGGRGSMAEPHRPEAWCHLVRAMRRIYPNVSEVPVTHRWFGRVAMTLDHLPHIHEPAPALLTAVGCQGRGIGLQTALGEALATSIVSGDRGSLPFPVTPIRPIPFHRCRNIGVGALITFYRMLDFLDSARSA